MTWKELAVRYPEFVQWCVQKYGPLPEGPIDHRDYAMFMLAYKERNEH
jgi:hypothetical protein